jgi:hypothetical protein
LPDAVVQKFTVISLPAVETPRRGVSTANAANTTNVNNSPNVENNKNNSGGHNPQWKPNSPGSILNQYKSVCTKKYGNP